MLSYNHTPTSHTKFVSIIRIAFYGFGVSRPKLLLPDFTLLKKSRTPPNEDLFVMEGQGLQGMKMRTNRNAWGMKFKAAGSWDDCYSGYR